MSNYYNSMQSKIHLSVTLSELTVNDRVRMAQDILRGLVLPQTRGEVCGTTCITDVELDAALQTVWTALNRAM